MDRKFRTAAIVSILGATIRGVIWDEQVVQPPSGGGGGTVEPPPPPPPPPPPNTLVDGDETAIGLYNQQIGGNLLDNVVVEAGETYSITSFTINSTQYAPGSAVIANVGTFNIGSNGVWTFTPVDRYSGAIPVVTYAVYDGDLTDSSTLTISDIVDPFVFELLTEDGFSLETVETTNILAFDLHEIITEDGFGILTEQLDSLVA